MSILLTLLTIVLVMVSFLLVVVVLAQKAKSDGGVGAALGGGMTEAAFGADTGNVLTKMTINLSIAFFVLSFVLYLGRIYERKHLTANPDNALPTIAAPAAAPVAKPVTMPAKPASAAPTAPSPTPAKP